jgi:hypothetical protein
MKKCMLYALLFGIPGILWSLLVTAILVGVLSGVLWLFVYGDSAWSQAAGELLSMAFLPARLCAGMCCFPGRRLRVREET